MATHSKNASFLLLLLAACATAAQDEVHDMIDHGRYVEALALAEEELAADPNDPDALYTHRRAQVAYLLDAGRKHTFEDRDVEALATFYDAQAISGENVVVQSWIDKTNRKLAERWLDFAYELAASEKLEESYDAFSKVLEWVPGEKRALDAAFLLTLVASLAAPAITKDPPTIWCASAAARA